ncbi:hypothetical protein HW132_07445 [Brasilonema sp. CT11]|nr:hypothetical protein [Brasilonema sp. CT11]
MQNHPTDVWDELNYVPVKQVSTFQNKVPDKKMTPCNNKTLLFISRNYLISSALITTDKENF